MGHRGRTWQEIAIAKPFAIIPFGLAGTFFSGQQIQLWRKEEYDAGRPSALDDFYRAHKFRWACRSTGINPHAIDRDGETLLFEECESCNGTGRVIDPSIETKASFEP
jgi:hypothetical protein